MQIDPRIHSYRVYSPLFIAVCSSYYKFVAEQLKKGENPNEICDENGLPLSLLRGACEQGDIQMMKLLLRFGADPNIGASCLYGALLSKSINDPNIRFEVIQTLINYGAAILLTYGGKDFAQLIRKEESSTLQLIKFHPKILPLIEKEKSFKGI